MQFQSATGAAQVLQPATGPLYIAQIPAPSSPRPGQTLALSLVLPTYNERGNIAPLVAQLTRLLDAMLPGAYELILVDDDSPDGTWAVALGLVAAYPQLRVMRRRRERGLSSAVIRGWQLARGQILAVIDADLQHPPDLLRSLWQAMAQGADLAIASRHIDGGGVSDWNLIRRGLSRGAQVLGLVLLPGVVGRVSDPMSGYFMVRRDAIADRPLQPKGYKILLELLGRGQIETIAEVGYVFQERSSGQSKVTWRQYIEYLHHLWSLRWARFAAGPSGRKLLALPISRFLKFGLVGLSGVLVDMAVLYGLHDGLGLALTRSKILAAEVAILNNFVWNDAWTFADISMGQLGWPARLKRLLKFNAICLAGLILNVLVLNLLYNLVFDQCWPYLANLMAIATVTLWNFWINLKLNWRVTQIK